MIQPEQSRTDLGTIRIHREAIASATLIATTEINGVKSVGNKRRGGFLPVFAKKDAAYIRVEFDKNQRVLIDIPVIIRFGYNIPEVADKIQENVRNSLEQMTDLSIRQINIDVRGIEKE